LALSLLIQPTQNCFEQNPISVEVLEVVSTLAGLQIRQIAKQAIERRNLIATH